MSHVQAPYPFVEEHYEHTARVDRQFPEVADFVLSSFRHLRGDAILNVGCGTTFYDYLVHFGYAPRRYVGIDINVNTFEYLRQSNHPRLLQAKVVAKTMGTDVEFICADVFDYGGAFENKFDSVLGVGVFATFAGKRFERLMEIVHRALKENGSLVKVTWHGPHRSPAQTLDKHRYGFDNEEETSPEGLIKAIESAGFVLRHNEMLECDPKTYRWDAIQVSAFEKV